MFVKLIIKGCRTPRRTPWKIRRSAAAVVAIDLSPPLYLWICVHETHLNESLMTLLSSGKLSRRNGRRRQACLTPAPDVQMRSSPGQIHERFKCCRCRFVDFPLEVYARKYRTAKEMLVVASSTRTSGHVCVDVGDVSFRSHTPNTHDTTPSYLR